MKKMASFKLVLLAVVLFSVTAVSLVYAQTTEIDKNNAFEAVSATEQFAIPTTKADKIAFFEQRRAEFLNAGNTAAAAYCTKAIETVNAN